MGFKRLFVTLIFLKTACFLQAQNFPGVQWKKCFGGSDLDYLMDIQQTFDGGYITAGFTYSNDGDISNYRDSSDCWVVKLKPSGEIEWKKDLGGTSYDGSWAVQQTNDSGYIIGSSSSSTDGDVTGNHGAADYWITKLDKQGNVEWQRSYGGSSDDNLTSIVQTTDGGYMAAGFTYSDDGDISGNHGVYDYWLVRLDGMGNILWQKCLGGAWEDYCSSVIQTKDGGFAVAGHAYVFETIRFTPYNYIVKMDAAGNIQWEQTIDDYLMGLFSQIVQTSDGGYILPGSYNTPISSNSYVSDAFLLKLDANGAVVWQKVFDTNDFSVFTSVTETSDHNYMACGNIRVDRGRVDYNSWIVNVRQNGEIVWEKQMGGSGDESVIRSRQTKDGYCILANSTWSTDGDVTGNHGGLDYWVVKLGPAFSFDLSSFKAERKCEGAELAWQTNAETSTAFFEIQRSQDGIDFKTIASVPAAVNAEGGRTYQYRDNAPFQGENYYRLKIVSTYGTFEYSATRNITLTRTKGYFFPNPAVSVITIIPKCTLRIVQVFTLDGRLISNLPVPANDQYNISRLPAGKYFLRLTYDSGAAEVLQLMKL